MKKKWAVLLAAGLLTASLAGCGGAQKEEGQAASSGGADTENTADGDGAEAADNGENAEESGESSGKRRRIPGSLCIYCRQSLQCHGGDQGGL